MLADLARALAALTRDRPAAVVHVARDGTRSASLEAALRFFAPEVDVLTFPAWDCQPYDRVSPNPEISSRRMTALSRLARTRSSLDRPRVLCATVNGLLQRVAPVSRTAAHTFSAAPGNSIKMDELAAWLETMASAAPALSANAANMPCGAEFSTCSPPGHPPPVRLDFFGDTLELIRSFDPETQRTIGQLRALDLVPISEAQLTTETMRGFVKAMSRHFGAQTRGDSLYEAICEGRRYPGFEHWLPLFLRRIGDLFDYCRRCPLRLRFTCGGGRERAAGADRRLFDARKSAL